MSSILAQAPGALPNPAEFKPRDNPAFILHSKLKTSYETVSVRECDSDLLNDDGVHQLPVPDVGPDEVLVEVKKTVRWLRLIANSSQLT